MRRSDRSDWTPFSQFVEDFLAASSEATDQFLIDSDDLAVDRSQSHVVAVEVRLYFVGGLFLEVHLNLERDRRDFIRLERYSYHAGVAGRGDRPIFRYDNAHRHPGHPDAHHRHRFDHRFWLEITPPEWIGVEGAPDLAMVIAELREWWQTTGRFLAEKTRRW